MRRPELARRLLVLVGAALVLGACPSDPPDPPESQELLVAEAWVRVTDEASDLFADMRPADAVCDDEGWFVDPFRRSLEVETDLCNYLTVSQPTLVSLAPGDVVSIAAYHDELTADAPASGYLGLSIDGELVWSTSVDIPAAPGTIEESFTVEAAVAVGAEAQFHVHNHGPNTWELVTVLVEPGT